jgi:serine/threonine-protein kinase
LPGDAALAETKPGVPDFDDDEAGGDAVSVVATTVKMRPPGRDTPVDLSRGALVDTLLLARGRPAADAGARPGAWHHDAAAPLDARFALGSPIGRGGAGEVYVAHDELLNREVAVKLLHSKVASNARVLARFLREAQVTAQLSHPGVVPVHGLEESPRGGPALSMKLVRGITFARYIAECREAPGTAAWDPARHGIAARLEHFLKACDAMEYSHSRGVIHRDLKPQNLMLGAFHEVYVMDWGVARVVGEPEDASGLARDGAVKAPTDAQATVETQFGEVLGSPLYLSP